MKHKHEKWIHLMADGVRIETAVNGEWIGAYWGDFNDNNLTFRIAPNQPADKDGWITWYGGETPAISERIDVLFKDWPPQKNTTAGQWRWEIKDRENDIVAYRIVKEKKWRWMYIDTLGLYRATPACRNVVEAQEWLNTFTQASTLGPRQDWTEVECDE